MTTKTYLGQARFLDMRIKSKIQQIDSLRELATSCTAVFSDMPRNPNHGSSKVERCVLKIIEVQEGLKDDINELVELKKNYATTITVNVQEDNPDAEGVGSDWESWSDF